MQTRRGEVTTHNAEKNGNKLEFIEEIFAGRNAKDRLKFDFPFKDFFPERGLVIYKDLIDKEGDKILETAGIVKDTQGQLDDPYYWMQMEFKIATQTI